MHGSRRLLCGRCWPRCGILRFSPGSHPWRLGPTILGLGCKRQTVTCRLWWLGMEDGMESGSSFLEKKRSVATTCIKEPACRISCQLSIKMAVAGGGGVVSCGAVGPWCLASPMRSPAWPPGPARVVSGMGQACRGRRIVLNMDVQDHPWITCGIGAWMREVA